MNWTYSSFFFLFFLTFLSILHILTFLSQVWNDREIPCSRNFYSDTGNWIVEILFSSYHTGYLRSTFYRAQYYDYQNLLDFTEACHIFFFLRRAFFFPWRESFYSLRFHQIQLIIKICIRAKIMCVFPGKPNYSSYER